MTRIPILSDVYDKISGKQPEPREVSIPSESGSVNPETILQQYYGDAYWRFQDANQEVQSKEHMINSVKISKFSQRCENAFVDFIATYYDRNLILANLSDPRGVLSSGGGGFGNTAEIEYIHVMINEMSTILSNCYPSDRRNPAFVRFYRLIPAQVRLRLSRTTSPDRERLLGARVQISSLNEHRVSPHFLKPREEQ